jgi:hypothetical protein
MAAGRLLLVAACWLSAVLDDGIRLAIRSVMRIQETDRILKESRYARHAAHTHEEESGLMSRAWRMVSGLPTKLTGLFRKQ